MNIESPNYGRLQLTKSQKLELAYLHQMVRDITTIIISPWTKMTLYDWLNDVTWLPSKFYVPSVDNLDGNGRQ